MGKKHPEVSWSVPWPGQSGCPLALLDSTSATGPGDIEVSIASDLDPWPQVGQPVTIFPGCDGRGETCHSVFGNYARFGGFPFMPVGNPSMVKMPQNRHMK